jgi:hypothetical protein
MATPVIPQPVPVDTGDRTIKYDIALAGPDGTARTSLRCYQRTDDIAPEQPVGSCVLGHARDQGVIHGPAGHRGYYNYNRMADLAGMFETVIERAGLTGCRPVSIAVEANAAHGTGHALVPVTDPAGLAAALETALAEAGVIVHQFSAGVSRQPVRPAALCPTHKIEMSLTGICDYC